MRAREAGVELDIGELPTSNGRAVSEGEDPERLARIVAHLVARVGDRFTIVRRISRHLEGEDKRSGLLSDLSAACIELYKRNPDVVEQLGKQAAANFSERRNERRAATNSPVP